MTPRARLLLAAAVLALLPAGAEPHAALVRSTPASRAVLAQSPPRVDLWFNERLEPAYSSLSVWDASGARVDGREVSVGRDDPRRLSGTLPPLPPGRYLVRYRVLSVDGHVVESAFPFTVRAAVKTPA